MTRTSPAQVAFSSGEISPLLRTRFDYQRFQTGLAACRGFIPMLQGGVTRAPGTLHLGRTRLDGPGRLINFEFAANDSVILEFTNLRMRVWRYGALVGSPTPYELVTPFSAASLDRLQWVQSADVIYITDGLRPIQRLARYALDDWTIGPVSVNGGPFRVQNLDAPNRIQASAATGTVTLTASWAYFDASHLGGLVQLAPESYESVALWTGNTEIPAGTQVRYDGRIYVRVDSNGNSGVNAPVHDEGIERVSVDPDVRWEYKSDGVGIVRITEILSGTQAKAQVIRPLPPPVVTQGTYRWSEGAWSPRHGYPTVLELHEQRLVAAASPGEPRTLWFSAVGDYADFRPGVEADESFAYSIGGGASINRILWLKSGRDGLHIGALGEEHSSIQPNRTEPLSAINISFRFGSAFGSRENIRPIAPDGLPMFISKDGGRLIEISYSLEKDANIASVLSRPADHFGAEGFAEIAWQSAPQRMAWLRTDAGGLVVMIYDPAEDVLGWAWCPVAGGHVESIAITRDAQGQRDVLTMIVRRQWGGVTRRFVEEHAVTFGTRPGLPDIREAVHLFCAAVGTVMPKSDTWSVPHLSEQQVYAWTEEGQFGPLTVSPDGYLFLPIAVSSAVIGIMDDTHHVRTLPMVPNTPTGTSLHRRKRLSPPFGIGMHQSAAGLAGVIEADFGQGERAWPAQNVVPRAVAAVLTRAFTGVARVPLTSGWADELALDIRPVGAAPLTITAIVPIISEAGI